MRKAVDRDMVIRDVHLLEKSGGKIGEWKATQWVLTSEANKNKKIKKLSPNSAPLRSRKLWQHYAKGAMGTGRLEFVKQIKS